MSSKQDKFTLDISSLNRPPAVRRSKRLNKDVIIFELSLLFILYTCLFKY